MTASILEVTLREGKNREVRRTFARVGHKVVSLKRTRIGPLTDRGIKLGKWRALSRAEVEALLIDGAGRPTTGPVHPSFPIDRAFPEEAPQGDVRRPRESDGYDEPVDTGYGSTRRPRRGAGASRGGSGSAPRRGSSASPRSGGASRRRRSR
jgi:hypothetical protein